MKRKKSRFALASVATVVLLLVAYPLSVGPACFLLQYFNWGPLTNEIADAVVLFYSPLDYLPEPMNTWLADWWNYGNDLGAAWND